MRARPLVLIVEDYDDSREVYAELLSMAGYDVIESATGLDAVTKAAELLPDVILMDYSLPEIDGSEATRRIKADARSAHIPVVLLTGMPSMNMSPVACDAKIAKPCDPDALMDVVQRMLARPRG